MDKHLRNYLISLAVFVAASAVFIVAGPENHGVRVGAYVVLTASIPVILVATWKTVPGRLARREAKAAAAAAAAD
ncbi:hypothetical protein [Pseudarthrobacter sp. BIM B-2242]|uniref:hypothetical protein n=1 Tax=Pseudarthrobacter sp. BIM B-2242 TaxID=2772401 RepID=UPI00168BFB85|nr:hypothetical protein [Pseudarthrobacter sp. BIM B-2242]QOD06079.1 hypothetical protein IDT60_21185 [Pseudarthrobacter sp. BIM B-2242]